MSEHIEHYKEMREFFLASAERDRRVAKFAHRVGFIGVGSAVAGVVYFIQGEFAAGASMTAAGVLTMAVSGTVEDRKEVSSMQDEATAILCQGVIDRNDGTD